MTLHNLLFLYNLVGLIDLLCLYGMESFGLLYNFVYKDEREVEENKLKGTMENLFLAL